MEVMMRLAVRMYEWKVSMSGNRLLLFGNIFISPLIYVHINDVSHDP